jgi:hypothetical protein
LRAEYPHSFGLVDALNLRLENALQSMLGISSEGLKELFLRLRRALGQRRLVLLLEDITAWQGVDSTLIDVLVTNVETREDADLCPMVSVVGVTPEYFRSAGFHTNYRQRITHHIRLGHENHLHQYQDVSSLRTADAQVAFAARYLRAVRTGAEGLVAWNGSGGAVPNRTPVTIARGARDAMPPSASSTASACSRSPNAPSPGYSRSWKIGSTGPPTKHHGG